MNKITRIAIMLATMALVGCSSIKSVRITEPQQANYKDFDDTEPIYKLNDMLQLLNESLETDVYNRNLWDMNNDSTIMVFDKKVNLVSEMSYTNTGYNIITNKWEKGLLVEKEERDYVNFLDRTNVKNCKNEYDGKNLIKTITTYDNDSTNKYLTEFFRNKDGVVACEVRYDKNNGVSSVCVNTIDSGKIIKEEDITVDGTFSCITKYKYADGKLISKYDNSCLEDKDKSFIDKHSRLYSYEYDGDNVTVIKSASENYTSYYYKDNASVFEYEKFKKAFEEELNKMTEEEVKKEEKEEPVKKQKDIHKYVNQVTLEYDEHNNIVAMRYYDDWEELEYIYKIAYEFDKHGNWAKMTITWNDKLMLVREREIKY